MLKWVSMPFHMSQGRTSSTICHSNHAVSSVVCSFLHGHPFSYLYYFTFALSSLPCLLCSISCWPRYPHSCHFHFPLSLCFCKVHQCQLVSVTDCDSQIPVFSLYLLLGCSFHTVLRFYEMHCPKILFFLFFKPLSPHEISLFCLLRCFLCTVFCKFLCHNFSFILLSSLGHVTPH